MFDEKAKPVLVEAVIAESVIQALDEGVLNGFTRLDVIKGPLSPEVTQLQKTKNNNNNNTIKTLKKITYTIQKHFKHKIHIIIQTNNKFTHK